MRDRSDFDDAQYDRAAKRRSGRGETGVRLPNLPLPGVAWIILGVSLLLLLLAVLLPGSAGRLVSTLALVCAVGFLIVGGAWLLLTALSDSVVQLLLCLFVPFYTLFFVANNWEETKRPFGLYLLGILMLAGSTFAAERHERNEKRNALVANTRNETPVAPQPQPEPPPVEPKKEPPKITPKITPPKVEPKTEPAKLDPESLKAPFEVDPQA